MDTGKKIEKIHVMLRGLKKALGDVQIQLDEVIEEAGASLPESKATEVHKKLKLLGAIKKKGGSIPEEDGQKLAAELGYTSWGPLFRGKNASLVKIMISGKPMIALTGPGERRLEDAGLA